MIDFNTLLHYATIHDAGLLLLIWVTGGLIFNLVRWRSTIKAGVAQAGGVRGLAPLKVLGVTVGRDVLLQLDMRGCSVQKWVSHTAVFWGFITLGLATTLNYAVNSTAVPLPLSHPVRLLGNAGGLLFMIGLGLMIYERAAVLGSRRNTSLGDAFFITLLFAVGLSGFATEVSSEFNSALTTSVAYWTHLAATACLFIVAPFSKFIHALGRTVLYFLENLKI